MTKARDLANASTALSAVSATELGYLDGVTSAVQTQLDNKVDETGGSVISANSSGNALEVRQTGAGKALVIEDEANPDSTPFVVAADGKVGIGVSNPTGQPLEIGSGSFGIRVTRYSATSYAGSGIDLRKSSSGTVGTDAAVASEDRLGRVLYSGYDGTSYVSPTEIGSDVDGTVSTGVVPSRLYFATASTAGTVTERMRIDSNGRIKIPAGGVLESPLVQNQQTASYTLVLADAGKLVEISNASANNLTVPLNSSVAYPVGTQINILQTGAGQTTVVATGGVTINGTPGLKLRAQWSSATLIKRATDTWVLVGDLAA